MQKERDKEMEPGWSKSSKWAKWTKLQTMPLTVSTMLSFFNYSLFLCVSVFFVWIIISFHNLSSEFFGGMKNSTIYFFAFVNRYTMTSFISNINLIWHFWVYWGIGYWRFREGTLGKLGAFESFQNTSSTPTISRHISIWLAWGPRLVRLVTAVGSWYFWLLWPNIHIFLIQIYCNICLVSLDVLLITIFFLCICLNFFKK